MKSVETANENKTAALETLLGDESDGLSRRRRVWLAGALIAAIVVGVGVAALRSGDRAKGPRYKTEPATVGRLVVKVSATGSIKPTNEVDVGSELSGIASQVLVEENDRVKKGQVLAQLDLSKLKDAVTRSHASLAAAEAQLLQAQATVTETRAALARDRQMAELSEGKAPSKSEMDTAEANLKRAEANEAAARASVVQARSNLQSDETDLGKASIRSPIDGVVLTRKIEPGQTVAAAFQAPVLFELAEDLTKMKLQVDVDEADVARVKEGLPATFAVDAWPGRKFAGVITRVDYGSQTKDNVVSYPTVIVVGNDDLSLRPGMTATADIITVTRDNALLVPNAALRFTPPVAGPTAGGRSGGIMTKLLPHPPSSPAKPQAPANAGEPRVWVLRDGRAVPIDLQVGVSNGQVTEVLGGLLQAGMQLITEAAGSQP